MSLLLRAAIVISFVVLNPSQLVWADDYETLMVKLKSCRTIKGKDQRLHCFEALAPLGAVAPIPTTSVAPQPSADKVKEKVLTSMLSEKPVAVVEKVVVDKREEFGAEHISKPKEKSPERRENIYRVIKTRQNQNKLYFFTMGNGHVWRQMERQRILVPKGQAFDVVITQGTFGDYRLRIEGKGRRIRVKRVR